MIERELNSELHELVRNAIANDYEDLAMILMEVTKWANEDNLAVDQAAIKQALWELVEAGHARGYNLGGPAQHLPPPPVDGYSEDPNVYYLLTRLGHAAIKYD